jgi:hypothetical protein
MKRRKLSLLCLPLVFTILIFTLLVIASNEQLGAAIRWLPFMEILTPTLILGLALTIHFVHKARAGWSFSSNGDPIKIAAITDDDKTISKHFGRAPYYIVVTVDDAKITDFETRDNKGSAQFQREGLEHHGKANEPRGSEVAAQDRDTHMLKAVADRQVLLCRDICVYERMKASNIFPVVTDIANIDEAIIAFAYGQMIDHIEKLH